jgi:hypothetical protein
MTAAPATPPRCDWARMALVGLVLIVWGVYIIMTRQQGETVGVEILAGGPAGAVLLAKALIPTAGRRRDGTS